MARPRLAGELFERSATGMLIADPKGRIVRANEAACRLAGVEALAGRQLRSITAAESRGLQERLDSLRDGSVASADVECLLARTDGSEVWADLSLTRLTDSSLFVLLRDTSGERRAREELRRAKETAEAATEVKSRFLANMSHEIRTPIHTIIGMGELLAETTLDEEQREYAAQIHFAADILRELVEDILDFSRIEAGKLAIESMDFDLFNLVEGSVDLLALEAHKKSLEMVTWVSPGTPRRVVADPHRIRQIIINLVKNAIKFTHAGEIEVGVELVTSPKGKEFLRFTVRDTGIGIPEAVRSRLFRSFSQVDPSTTRKYGGSGLGLTICKGLAELMGGRIGVTSRESSGSVFWFVLPLKRSAQAASDGEAALAGQKILVVDDNASVRRVLTAYLAAHGATVEEVPDGEAALAVMGAAAASRPFDVALIDTRLPGIDGWQLGSRISGDRLLNSTRLILLTPAGKSADEAKMMLLRWFDGYLPKPVRQDQLLEVVGRATRESLDLEEVPAGEPLEAEPPPPATDRPLLVAEDHEVNQALFRTILERMGYRVHVAGDGEVAVSLARQHCYAIIFMDVQMPNLNGIQATEAIRAAGVDTPVIAVTASALTEDMQRCYAAGMNDVLTKPFKKRDLEPLLARWIGAVSSPDEEAEAGPTPGPEAREIFDWEEAVQTFMGEDRVVLDLVGKWRSRAETALAEVDAALAAADFEALEHAAHGLKGSSLNLAINRVGKAAAELQEAAAAMDRERALRLASRLHAAYEELVAALPSILPA